jgi:putative SOS response-associated peptidase YedK
MPNFRTSLGSPSKGFGPAGLAFPIHDRMPIILDPDGCELWLDPWMKDMGSATELLKPCDARPMRCYP